MARDHARIKTSVWGDEDWRELPWQAQWLYDTLLSQPSPPLTRVGVIPWRPRLYAALAQGCSPVGLAKAARCLEEARFVVIDHDTEELLIRSMIRHDGVLDRVNMGKAVGRALQTVVSLPLRHVIYAELARAYEERPNAPGWAGIGELFPHDLVRIKDLASTLPIPITSRMT